MDKIALGTSNGILLSHKKEWILVGSKESAEPRDFYREWRKSIREKQILYIQAHVWGLEK